MGLLDILIIGVIVGGGILYKDDIIRLFNSTSPIPGETLTFAAAGDWGSGFKSAQEKAKFWGTPVPPSNNIGTGLVVARKAASYNPDQFLMLGDYSYVGGASAFAPTIKIFSDAGIPVFGANGNHDMSTAYCKLWGQQAWIASKVVGNVTFVSLDSDNSSASITFAKQILPTIKTKWKVVIYHRPTFEFKSQGTPSPSTTDSGRLKSLVPLFEQYGVQLVLTGHAHNYQRLPPKNGVTYITIGTGGVDLYPKGWPSVPTNNMADYGFGLFEVSSSAIYGKFITENGTVKDSFQIG